MFLMMLTGLSLKTMVIIIKWIAAVVGQYYHVVEKSAKRSLIYRMGSGLSFLFFNPSKLKSKLT
jgi:hypothetical protein